MAVQKTKIIKVLREMLKVDYPGITSNQLKGIYDAIMLIFKDFLKTGKSIKLPGIGILKIVTRKEKTGRNLKTNETILIPERKVVVLKQSKNFKINQ